MSTPLKRKLPGSIPASTGKKQKQNSITSFFSAPAAAPSSSPTATAPSATTATTSPTDDPTATTTAPAAPPAPPRPKFDKEKWASSLPAATRDLLKLEIETMHESWLAVLKDEVTTPSFLELKRFLAKEKESGKKIFPKEEEIYSWSQHTPLPTVKAVILGQDPYHNTNQAHGLAFSVRPPEKVPPSLKNIYIALKNDYPTFKPPPKDGGLLTPWADRGILLLNTCLTVEAHQANSHANRGWEKLTQKVIDTVARVRTRGVVFLAWGSPAGKRFTKVNRQVHCVLQSVHPSPLSAHKGFFTCGHFKKTNEWLKERYGASGEIDWNLDLPPQEAGL